jgi:type IV secretion system protein VirD4
VSVEQLIAGERVTIYIEIPPSRLASHKNVLRVWLGGILRALMRREPGFYQNPTLLLIDEAAQLGRLSEIETVLTLMRGYGVRIWTFWQSVDQIKAIYRESAPTIIGNSLIKQVFGPQSGFDIETIDRMLDRPSFSLRQLGGDRQALKIGSAPAAMARLPNLVSGPLGFDRQVPNVQR